MCSYPVPWIGDSNMTLLPADELALVRAQIRELQKRETELCCGFLRDELDPTGTRVQARTGLTQKRVFQADLLPEFIYDDPIYWQTDFDDFVELVPLDQGASSHQGRQVPGQAGGLSDEIPPQFGQGVYSAHAEVTQATQ
jgi:hypothetical protein